ncbi:MAG: hypothetical protein IJM45_01705, partial [Clostridia bacterium]|nr:hypothetical protein [Clostridia bacterium]
IGIYAGDQFVEIFDSLFTVFDELLELPVFHLIKDMIREFIGFTRIFTILARGYLFQDSDGNLLSVNPYDRIAYARRALLAWSSVPDRSKNPKVQVDFSEYSAEFPDLVDENGRGWYYRHIKAVLKFIKKNPDLVNKTFADARPGISAGFTSKWKTKVRQFQVPIFSLNTKGAWTIRFDDIIADALEAGPLRMEEYPLPDGLLEKIGRINWEPSKEYVAVDLVRYYYANRKEETDWVVLPVANFCAYYGTMTFEKTYLPALPKDIFIRDRRDGVSIFKVKL